MVTVGLPAVIVVSACLVGLLFYADIDTPLRPFVGLWFLLVCPGLALVRLLHLDDLVSEVMLAVAFSLTLDALVASTMLYAGVWSPGGALAVLISVSIGGATLQALRAASRPSVWPRLQKSARR